MKKVAKKKLTLEDIASRMDKQFASVNQRFETLDKKIDRGFAGQAMYFKRIIEGLAISTAKSFDHMENRLDDVEEVMTFKFDGVNRRIDELVMGDFKKTKIR